MLFTLIASQVSCFYMKNVTCFKNILNLAICNDDSPDDIANLEIFRYLEYNNMQIQKPENYSLDFMKAHCIYVNYSLQLSSAEFNIFLKNVENQIQANIAHNNSLFEFHFKSKNSDSVDFYQIDTPILYQFIECNCDEKRKDGIFFMDIPNEKTVLNVYPLILGCFYTISMKLTLFANFSFTVKEIGKIDTQEFNTNITWTNINFTKQNVIKSITNDEFDDAKPIEIDNRETKISNNNINLNVTQQQLPKKKKKITIPDKKAKKSHIAWIISSILFVIILSAVIFTIFILRERKNINLRSVETSS